MNISICTPIYNRNKCKELIINNLNNFDYPKDKLEYIILDDGDDKFIKNNIELEYFKNKIYPIKFKYIHHNQKEIIGKKRNKLVKLSKYNLIAMMDSDDLYTPQYLKHSLEIMKQGNYNIVGSNQMLFCYTTPNIEDKWLFTGIQCNAKSLIHEATMIFNKKHFNAMGFATRENRAEGARMVEGMTDKNVGLTDISKCMLCLCHPNNTIPKDIFKDKNKLDIQLDPKLKELIIKSLY
jgi:cellulose synthase/poly-beta-1,6-N-acetylglucosamine synthase-like glycosyltransferase